MKTIACLLFLAAAFLEHPTSAGALHVQATSNITYEEFARLPQARRDEVFAQLGAETKAVFLRKRFEQWLAENRSRLNSRQVAAVQETINLVTPDFFQRPPAAREQAQQDAAAKKLRCSLGTELAYSFVKGETPPATADRTWSQIYASFTDWIVDCVMI